MMMMMIALKGAVRDFYNLLTAPQTVYAQVARAQSCANNAQHIERLSRATVLCHVVRRDSSAFKLH